MGSLNVSTDGCTFKPSPKMPTLRAGLRSSAYGAGSPFPDPDYWSEASASMALRFEGAEPAVVWILGTVTFPSTCKLNFPAPEGKTYENIGFNETDENEAYLDLFDETGVKVWLQVEPANADVLTLIDLVLKRYAAHPSVVGFGIDVEWHKWSVDKEGIAVTDAEAKAWSKRVRSYNPNYRLFLKHWLTSKMPPTFREGLMFLDDSQMFDSMDQMVNEFKDWGQTFAPAPVGFQYGYQRDRKWWKELLDPPRDIGQAILNQVSNATDLYWVDFTMRRIWPDQR